MRQYKKNKVIKKQSFPITLTFSQGIRYNELKLDFRTVQSERTKGSLSPGPLV